MKGLNIFIKDITKHGFVKDLGFTYLQYLQPNSSLQSSRIVGIYVFTYLQVKNLKKKRRNIKGF